jgi:hypothetical protein
MSQPRVDGTSVGLGLAFASCGDGDGVCGCACDEVIVRSADVPCLDDGGLGFGGGDKGVAPIHISQVSPPMINPTNGYQTEARPLSPACQSLLAGRESVVVRLKAVRRYFISVYLCSFGGLAPFRGRFLTAKVQEEICPKRWVVG